MKLSNRIPAIYLRCKKAFGVKWDKGVIITYGDTVYAKHPERISPDLIAHEATHIMQQKEIGADKWWGRYLADPAFRLSQEVEAYQNQVTWLKENNPKDIDQRIEHIIDCMERMYGGMCTKDEARLLLKL